MARLHRAPLAAAIICLMASPVNAMDIQGHRGARGWLPENTLPAFEWALGRGVGTLELDCGVTKDGVVVVHHDRRLNPDVARGADGKWVASPGPAIRSLTWEELQRYDVGRLRPGSDYAKRFSRQEARDGTRIPRLAEVLKLKAKFNIETKISPDAPEETVGPEEFARRIIQEIRQAGADATIQSFDWRTLKVVERDAPEIPTVYLTNGTDSEPDKVHQAGGRIWSPNFQDLTQGKLERARALGLGIVAWTVNERPDIVRILEMRIDGIISDYPDRVLAEMKRRRVR
jgi:glycerophosphoryl diester phosphodiesterase